MLKPMVNLGLHGDYQHGVRLKTKKKIVLNWNVPRIRLGRFRSDYLKVKSGSMEVKIIVRQN